MKNRFEELDSLRGIASMTVLVHHFISVGVYSAIVSYLNISPFRIFRAGHEAVIFFFVLSGFVLYVSLDKNRNTPYSSYVLKRICRIYLPFLIAILLSLFLRGIFYNGTIHGLSDFFNKVWEGNISLGLLLQHFLVLGNFRDYAINPVIWSLVVEMRVSFIFPILMILVKKFNVQTVLSAAFAMTVLGYLLSTISSQPYRGPVSSDVFMTLHYAAMFVIGAILAKHREKLISLMRDSRKGTKLVLAIVAFASYTFSGLLAGKLSNPFFHSIFAELLIDWVIAFGAAIFMIFAISLKSVSKILLIKPIVFLGKISYSVYLMHAIVLFTLIHSLYGTVPFSAIFIQAFVITIVISAFFYKYIEKPAMEYGRYLTNYKRSKIRRSGEFNNG
ncbi:acyltransferase [Bacillaceae bacterium Marseille-Q3522]|nr:acyltransferase [Bacillaceae bacterium Marseille-Q3522]